MATDKDWRVDVAGRKLDITRSLGEINMDDLSGEVQDAGGHSVWWGYLAAEASAEMERAKLALNVTESEIASNFRRDKARVGEKITEAMVAEHLTLHEKVREAKEVLIDAERAVAVLRAVSMAVNQKARTLENLSFLIGQEHGATRNPLRDRMREELPRRKREPV